MSRGKWSDDVRTAALTLMAQLHRQRPDASRRLVCLEVMRRMDPAPSLHTLLYWARAYAVFPRRPQLQLQSVCYVEPVASEALDVEPLDIDEGEELEEMEPPTLANDDDLAGALQEKAFDLRVELRNLVAAVEGDDDLEVLQAADEHLLAVESLLRSLGEQGRGKPPVRRAIAG
ncbi:hypothetical protein AB0L97_34845 [Nocardia sp. NPDC051911]|uniref:hypothetical protein n=1 Tax=Nocardia sp. NPDC051911 TaxID=3154648 RepID=UPI003445AE80